MALQWFHVPCVALLWTAALSHVRQRMPEQSFATGTLVRLEFAAGIGAGLILAGIVVSELKGGERSELKLEVGAEPPEAAEAEILR